MGKGSSAPAAPDPHETAAAESQYNRLDTYGPGGGGVRHGYTDESGNFVAGVAPEGYQSAQSYVESPYEQAIREALEPASVDLTNRIVDDNITNLPDAPRVADRSDVAEDLFNRNYSLMKDGFEQENDRLLTNLQARGLPIGSEAFNEAYQKQTDSVNDALSRLAMDANLAAGQEQSRQFGLDQSSRANAISELVAAMGGGYNPPGAIPSGQAAGINYSQLVGQQYDAEMAQYQARTQQRNAMAGALGNIGGAMLMKSDRRLKTDIVPVAQRDNLTVYAYRYLWERPGTVRVGYMAQDVLKVIPRAVEKIAGWLHVNYDEVPEVAHG